VGPGAAPRADHRLGFAWTKLPVVTRWRSSTLPCHERFRAEQAGGPRPVPACAFRVSADGGWMPHVCRAPGRHPDAVGISTACLAVTPELPGRSRTVDTPCARPHLPHQPGRRAGRAVSRVTGQPAGTAGPLDGSWPLHGPYPNLPPLPGSGSTGCCSSISVQRAHTQVVTGTLLPGRDVTAVRKLLLTLPRRPPGIPAPCVP